MKVCESEIEASQFLRGREGLQTLGDSARDSLRGFPSN
jgi:hypothetical protein